MGLCESNEGYSYIENNDGKEPKEPEFPDYFHFSQWNERVNNVAYIFDLSVDENDGVEISKTLNAN